MERQAPFIRQPEDRIKDFNEVSLGFDEEKARKEALRCLQCKNPKCISGCPVKIDIPAFINRVSYGNIDGALDIIYKNNIFPRICGRVCPQENQCEGSCVLGQNGEPVAIGLLERFVGTYGKCGFAVEEKREDKSVAVIGSGPASLTCAFFLARKGVKVTVYEAFHRPGGVLVYGIPEFRLPKKIVSDELEVLIGLGVQFEMNSVVGKTVSLGELKNSYDAVFIGTGAGLPMFMNIPGEGLSGVYSANEYLTRINLMKANQDGYDTPILRGKKAIVVGAGNVAMDAARTALRMGAEVTLVYRRGREEMPARREEILHAEEEGVSFELLTNPIEFLGRDGRVIGARCVRMELGDPDSSGRRRPREVKGSDFILLCDMVIVALGTVPNPMIARTEQELELSSKGTVMVDECGRTSVPRIYAGGDAVTGAATVIKAMGAGKTAANTILESFGIETLEP